MNDFTEGFEEGKKVKYVKPTEKDMDIIYNDIINNPYVFEGTTQNLGNILFWGRTSKGLTQNQLADMLGIKQNTLSRYETNSRQMPFELFAKAMKIFGLRMTIEMDDEKKDRD